MPGGDTDAATLEASRRAASTVSCACEWHAVASTGRANHGGVRAHAPPSPANQPHALLLVLTVLTAALEPDEPPLLLARLTTGLAARRSPAPTPPARVPVRRLAGRRPCNVHVTSPTQYTCTGTGAPGHAPVARPSTCLDPVALFGHVFTWRGVERTSTADRHRLLLCFSPDSATMYIVHHRPEPGP